MSDRLPYASASSDSWDLASGGSTVFDWQYDKMDESLATLYRNGKAKQWDADKRLDWSYQVDPENTSAVPDEINIPIFGSPMYAKLGKKELVELRRNIEAWRVSQFLHGEQGALICASRIVQNVPDLDAKFYAATQVVDEARHVEVYSRYLREKVGLAYPINPKLKTLLDQVISDARWDFTYLGMQVLIEGLALAAFAVMRDISQNPLFGALNAYVMQDEARHVAFGRLALREFYPHLTAAERREREQFVVEACYLMRDRFMGEEVWEVMGFDVPQCVEYVNRSEKVKMFRQHLFMRIVPIIKDIGLWGESVQKAYADMGVIQFAALDPDALAKRDDEAAEKFDARAAAART